MSDLSSLESNHYYKPFTSSIAGFIVPMITGLLSACSSGLIIYIISKSQQKLSTTYHRIMAFMSFFDIISSIFIAIGTIMMPSDTIYKFAGPMLGNKVTCQIQGWLIIFGITGAASLYDSLAWYFVLNITFKLSSRTITCYIEPLMHIYAIAFSFFIPTFFLKKDLLNPHVYDGFCIIAPYPDTCDDEMWYDWHNCTWGEGVIEEYLKYTYVPLAGIGKHFVSVLIGMSLIIWTVVKTKRKIQDLEANEGHVHDTVGEAEIQRQQNIEGLKFDRVLIIQSLMYIATYFMTWLLLLLSGGFNIASFELDAASSFFFPLQGLWNLLIFLYDKAYLIKQNDTDTTRTIGFWQAAKKVLTSPANVPVVVLSDISGIIMDRNKSDDLGNGDHKENEAIASFEEMSDFELAQISSV